MWKGGISSFLLAEALVVWMASLKLNPLGDLLDALKSCVVTRRLNFCLGLLRGLWNFPEILNSSKV